MPHSSGGGSHRGGSHSSHSHHSSSHSHSSSSRGSSHSLNRTSSSSFKGSTRYVYYKNSRPVFVYSNYDISKQNIAGDIVVIVWFALMGLGALAVGLLLSFHIPHKISPTKYTTKEVVIYDTIDVIDNEEELEKSMQAFLDKTGITPVVMTVSNESWKGNYEDIEAFAYTTYLDHFDDEYHWLIVYSQPENPDSDFNDWEWEGMQGDYTNNILTTKVTDAFKDEFHKDLIRENQYSVGDAFVRAFYKTNEFAMKVTFNGLYIICPGLIAVFFIGIAIICLIDLNLPKKKLYKKSVICPEQFVDQESCEYCGGIYIVGFDVKCPHCGAPVKPHDYTVNQDGELTEIHN